MPASLEEIISATAGHRRAKPRRFVRMFKPRFAKMVKSGEKRQTVRPVPSVMPRVGDIFDLRMWSGKPYWSKQVKLIETTVLDVKVCCVTTGGIFMQSPAGSIMHLLGIPFVSFTGPAADDFAYRDGFKDWQEMRAWFETEHSLPFDGIVIFFL